MYGIHRAFTSPRFPCFASASGKIRKDDEDVRQRPEGFRQREGEKPMKIVLATRNPGKVYEMKSLLAGLPVELIAAGDLEDAPDVEEDAATLQGNAAKKARALYGFTGLPSLADDTGLEVTALAGKPGVHSARYAGERADDAANRNLLLSNLKDVRDREARFRTVVAFVDQDGSMHYFEGICAGEIVHEERGSGGFGYDALFVPEGRDLTFAELPHNDKNTISHRGRALQQFAAYIRERLA